MLSFAGTILLGTFALMVPACTAGDGIRFIDALFTSTSAVCVTGLTVVDTARHFTPVGQAVILCLVQLGGLGIMTFSVVLLLLAGKRISIRGKMLVQDSFAPHAASEIHSIVKRLVLTTFLIEAMGALLLYVFTPDRTVFASLFHSVSAFCNAGFSLKSTNFLEYQHLPGVNLTACALIVLGGLGFFTLIEIGRFFRKHGLYRISLHSRIVLAISASLILLGIAGFLLFERTNILRAEGLGGLLLIPLFQSITARTAGFNTVDFGLLSNATLFLIILLMFIGASPGSTGGGLKTSTLGVLIALAKSRFRGEEAVSLFRRTIPLQVISKAQSVLVAGFVLVTLATLALTYTETGIVAYTESRQSFIAILFEVVSAFATVGLSTGITPGLTGAGKLILVLVMFVGRVGPLSIATLAGRRVSRGKYRYAEENVMVG